MKYFDVSNPSKTVTILSEQNSFLHLSDGNMIKKDKFELKYQPVLESTNSTTTVTQNTNNNVIDPASFFGKSALSTDDINKVISVDPSKINDNVPTGIVNKTVPSNANPQYVDNNSVIQQDTVMMEIEQMFENETLAYGQAIAQKNKNERLYKVMQERNGIKPKAQPINDVAQTPLTYESTTQPIVQQQQQLDPSEIMFKSFKRNHEIAITVNFKDKIAKPDFVKMMMENMEGDIIGYYKKLIMQNIKNNMNIIEYEVEKSIKLAIYGEDYVDEPDTEVGINAIIDDGGISNTKIITDIDKNGNETIEEVLIKGGINKNGRQLYKYVDNTGKVKEMLPEAAEKKGFVAAK
jgi:hypothetical protein